MGGGSAGAANGHAGTGSAEPDAGVSGSVSSGGSYSSGGASSEAGAPNDNTGGVAATAGAPDELAGAAGQAGQEGPCLTHSFQWLNIPPDWHRGSSSFSWRSNLLVSGNGCVVVGTLDSTLENPRTTTIFRWTESSGLEVLPSSNGAIPAAVSADGSTILSYTPASEIASLWTRGRGWQPSPLPAAIAMSADGSAMLANTISGQPNVSGYFWKNGTTEAVLPLPVPGGST
ncbi:MAG TPA: hypothetical protein VK745_17550, partial [Polyangiaceae bacterium]|nr:hypothetical protein [Polyangiaceae bacterium]